MNKTTDRWSTASRGVFSTLALLAVLSATVYAQHVTQKASSDSPVVYSGRANTPPVSGSKVTLKLSFSNGAVFTVTQFEGAGIRVTANGSTTVISTHLDAEHLNEIRATIFRVFSVEKRGTILGEGVSEIGSLNIKEGSDLTEYGLECKVEIVRIVIESTVPEGGGVKLSRVHIMSQEECCLTCSGYTVCGCAVSGPCGSCCCGWCC